MKLGSIQIWNLEDFGFIKSFDLPGDQLWDLQFNEKMIVVGVGQELVFIDWQTLNLVHYTIELLAPTCLQLDPLKVVVGGTGMIGLSLENGLKIWEGLKNISVGKFQYHDNTLIATHTDGYGFGSAKVSVYD